MSENVTKLHVAAPAAEEKTENSSAVFKPKPVELELNGEKYTLVYDLNAFCEMETMYDSVDTVINMLMGTPAPDISKVTYCDAPCQSSDIKIDGKPLTEYIQRLSDTPKAKYKDTLNLLWLGVLHDHTKFTEDGEVAGYTVSKAKLGQGVTLTNLREVNQKIITAVLRDLLPALVNASKSAGGDAKNAEAQESKE